MQRLNGGDLWLAEAAVVAGLIDAKQVGGCEARLAADRVCHQAVGDAVLPIAGGEHGVMHQLDLGRTYPAVAEGREPGARAGVLQADPVDHGHAGEDAVEIIGVALRHGQAFAPALRTADEIHFLRFCAVGPLDQHDGRVAHFLVGGVRKIDKGLVVGGKQLRRLARFCLMAGIGAVGRKSLRQRRGAVEGRRRRQGKACDHDAVEAAAAILHGAAVPLQRQIELKADRRRLRIGRVDMTEHAAE